MAELNSQQQAYRKKVAAQLHRKGLDRDARWEAIRNNGHAIERMRTRGESPARAAASLRTEPSSTMKLVPTIVVIEGIAALAYWLTSSSST